MTSPSLLRFFLLNLKVGNLTFGGGDPTMAVFHQEVVVFRQWLSPEKFALIYSLARVTPGTNLLAFCVGAGWEIRRWAGAAASVVAVSAPGAFLVGWFTIVYERFKSNPLAMAAIGGTLAAAIGMMAGASLQLLRPQWRSGGRMRTLSFALTGFALSAGLNLTPVQVLALGAAAGLLWRES